MEGCCPHVLSGPAEGRVVGCVILHYSKDFYKESTLCIMRNIQPLLRTATCCHIRRVAIVRGFALQRMKINPLMLQQLQHADERGLPRCMALLWSLRHGSIGCNLCGQEHEPFWDIIQLVALSQITISWLKGGRAVDSGSLS